MWGKRIPEIDEVKYKNLIININGYTDSEELGLAPRESNILGVSVLRLEEQDVTEELVYCLRHFVELDEQDYPVTGQQFETYNSGLIIGVFHHFLNLGKEVTIGMEINHFYWLFHDLVHAEEHSFNCDLSVGAGREKYTYLEAFNLAQEHGYYQYCLLKPEEAEDLIKAYNDRFGRQGYNLPKEFLNEYLLPEIKDEGLDDY
jgi:hypothetical protein